jgi:hypothetical protein
MRRQNQFGWLIGASVLGLATAALAPRGYGGGGDEGVDILPFSGPGAASDGFGSPTGMLRPPNGYLTVHGSSVVLDANDIPYSSGFRADGHTRADLYVGLPGTEPWKNSTGLDILMKGPRKLFFSDVTQTNLTRSPSYVHLNGRFEVTDLSANNGQMLELVSRLRKPTTVGLVIGHRSTHTGPIWPSFATVDQFLITSLPSGSVDLESTRADLKATYGGTGDDIGIVVYATTPRGVDEVWTAFNVDDATALFDVEVKLK